MWKETVICIIIVSAIILGNNMTQSFTKQSVSELSGSLEKLREAIRQNEVKQEEVKNEIDSVYEEWQKRHDKLAYFIEHDELEKVETELIAIRSYIETQDYEESVSERRSRCAFL